VKGNRLRSDRSSGLRIVALMIFAVLVAATACAQSGSDADGMQRRLARARALSAAHSLTAAAAELDSIRLATKDDAVREVTRIMLLGIYLEEADYMHAEALLEEIFKARSAQNDSSIQTYFALAGHAVNGARAHLERYRAFGINITDADLPSEATKDLDRLRSLLDRIAAQAKEMSGENGKSTDAIALLEEVASVRCSLARDDDERIRWQQDVAKARQRLASSETRVTTGQAARATTAGSRQQSSGDAVADNHATAGPVHPSTTPPPHDTAKSSGPAAPAANQPHPEHAASGSPHSTANNTEANGQVLNVGSLVDKATQKISPSYPETAKNAHITGIVTVYVIVDENGSVAAVQPTSGPGSLRQAAMDAARRWKFQPTMVDGQAVKVGGFINFNFIL
jgi:TonB family protein